MNGDLDLKKKSAKWKVRCIPHSIILFIIYAHEKKEFYMWCWLEHLDEMILSEKESFMMIGLAACFAMLI